MSSDLSKWKHLLSIQFNSLWDLLAVYENWAKNKQIVMIHARRGLKNIFVNCWNDYWNGTIGFLDAVDWAIGSAK
jgi:hypothetical protein